MTRFPGARQGEDVHLGQDFNGFSKSRASPRKPSARFALGRSALDSRAAG